MYTEEELKKRERIVRKAASGSRVEDNECPDRNGRRTCKRL